MSREYFRPVVQTHLTRSAAARTLAGGWAWFDQVEVLSRTAPPKLISANELPSEIASKLTSSRGEIAGLDLSRPSLMGILNVTPDSFSDGGQFDAPYAAVSRASAMVEEGADIVDVGGESTRPGASYIPVDEEIARTAPIIAAIRNASATPISIDTRKADVAQAALDAGATLVNDVYAFTHDPALAGVASAVNAPVCLMHAQGDPEVMQDNPQYDDVLLDIFDFLEERVEFATSAGIDGKNILVDPGIGFGKNQAQNLALLNRISLFHALGCGVFLGASRKKFIGTIGGAADAQDRAAGSIAVALAAVAQGVQVLRVHDIKETKQALALWTAVHAPAS